MLVHFAVRSAQDCVRARALARNGLGQAPDPVGDEHLTAAARWLERSIDVCGGRASSKGLHFLKGWMAPYPETSGYIIPTLFMLGRELGRASAYQGRALRIGEWLKSIQQPGGGFLAREIGAGAGLDVFDTGMILLGFNALLHETGAADVQGAAQSAAEFLVGSMDEEGCFVRHLSHGILHAYNVRSAWALAGYAQLSGADRFRQAALVNAAWTVAQQNEAGLYENNSFKPGWPANTHGLAYVMQGLLQIHDLTGSRACVESVVAAADTVRSLHHRHGWIPAELGPGGEYLSHHVCLTGYAQLAIVLYRLFQLGRGEAYRVTADQLLATVARTQYLQDSSKPYYGAIAGSYPIYGRYAPLQYPNWATKFFIDALLAKRQVDRGATVLNSLQLYAG
jgi:hypothetical protein